MDEKTEVLTSHPLSADDVKEKTKISEDFYTVFSNQARVAGSPTEFRLFFGENYPTATGEIRIVEMLSVVLTPIQAKHLAGNLNSVIQKIEEKFGTIPTVQDLQSMDAMQGTPPGAEKKQ